MAGVFADKMNRMYLEGADILVPYRFFFKGLVYWTLYGITRNSKYRRRGAKALSQLEKWVAAGVANCHHTLLLLRAERAAAMASFKVSKSDDVRFKFDQAISASARSGFLHDRALGNECAARFFLRHGNVSWASTYISRARYCYQEWGANGKVRQLDETHGELIIDKNANDSCQSSSLFSTSRLASFKKETINSLTADVTSNY